MFGSAIDVTRQVGLDRLKVLTDEILDSLPSLYYMVDQDGWVAKWNQKSIEVTGYSEEEQAALNILMLFDDADRPRVMDGMRKVFTHGHAAVEADLITRDGRRIPHLFSGKRIIVDGNVYLSGLGLDLSERKALEAQLQAQARLDALTGLPNRRAFFEALEREIAQARRSRRPLSLVMVDIDHFKAINDTHGHQAGDRALAAVGAALAEAVRGVDTAARFGGEEFAVVLHDTAAPAAIAVAERIRAAVADLGVPLAGGARLRMTASLGVASLRPGDAGADDLIERADAALYAAKNGGRDQVRSEDPAPLRTVG